VSSVLFEVATWLVYVLAAVVMLAVIVAAVLAGLALGLVARFLLELGGGGREEGETQYAEDGTRTLA